LNPIKRKTVLVGEEPDSCEAPPTSPGGTYMNKIKAFLRKFVWLTVSVAATGYISLETYRPGFTNEQMVKFVAPEWSREQIEKEIEVVTSAHGLPKELLAAIVDTESAYQIDAMRYEPAVFERLKGSPANSRMALASSHGLAQVMGYHAQKTCGLRSWIELTDPSKNLACAVTILNLNLKDSKGDVWTAVRMYNGSGSKAEGYANKVLANFTNLVVKGAQKNHAESSVKMAKRKGAVDVARIEKALGDL
jgi:soluble lytic murein transglycosylase-like protein